MLSLALLLLLIGNINSCIKKHDKQGTGTFCVCNSTYCDTVPEVGKLKNVSLKIYYTSQLDPGFNVKDGGFSNVQDPSALKIKVNTASYQKIIGFGGAFTDATGINIKGLPEEAQNKLLESYFGESGIGYSLCRVPLGGTDFSPRPYSLDDHDGDRELKYFELQPEDLDYKIPLIKQAKALRENHTLNLFTSVWTAPPWMKNNQVWSGFSLLEPDNYQVFANYIKKFFDEYQKEGITFWGMTTGNEPLNGFYLETHTEVNSMGWTTNGQGRWIMNNLGPTLQNSTYKDIKIMIHDEGLITLPYMVPPLLEDKSTLKYIDGVATHWYWDDLISHQVRNLAKSDQKDIFRLSTESCYFISQPLLGSWDRAAGYIDSIIDHINYGYGGWVDWNMVLNITGGPTYIGYPADAPIIVSEDNEEFYKQPMFYAMGHFSKFVIPDSVVLDVSQEFNNTDIKALAFLRPDNLKAVIVFNNETNSTTVQIEDRTKFSEAIEIPAKSISTILYKN